MILEKKTFSSIASCRVFFNVFVIAYYIDLVFFLSVVNNKNKPKCFNLTFKQLNSAI